MITRSHRALLAFCLTLVAAVGVALLEKGIHGWLLFVIIPFAIGLLAACVARVFRTGVAYPTEARIDGSGPGAIRKCQFSTGAFVEPITVWDEPHLLRFRVTHNPAPLGEWSPWGAIRPAHLQGYLASEGGQFQFTPLSRGRSLLTGTTWYRRSLLPAQYWRGWSDSIIHRIRLRVLNHVRNLAKQETDAAEQR